MYYFRYLLLFLYFGIAFTANNRYINNVEFDGNYSIPSKELVLVTKSVSRQLFNKTKYNPKLIKVDELALKTYYLSKGYLDAQVHNITDQLDENNYNITFHINEGIRYKLQNIDIVGNKLFSDQKIQTILDHNINEFYNPVKIRSQLIVLKERYLVLGKIKISIVEEIEIIDNKVILRINISEGITYKINNITIFGLEKLPKMFVMRELLFSYQDIYNSVAIKESQKRIFSSGVFSSVEMIPKIVNNFEDFVDIDIKIREYNNRTIEGRIGFDQEESPMGEGAPPMSTFNGKYRWTTGNLFNTTGRLEFKGGIGVKLDEDFTLPQKEFSVVWRAPWTLGFRIPLRIKYFYDETYDNYSKITQGLETSLFYVRGENYRFLTNLNFQYIKSDVDNINNYEIEDRSSLKFTYIYEDIENFLYPQNGIYFMTTSTIGSTIEFSKLQHYKFDAEFKQYFDYLSPIILSYRFKIGFLEEVNVESLQFYDKFYLGGSTSLRGWKTTEDFNSNGGNLRVLFNSEIRFPIFWKIGGELFVDAGQLMSDYREILEARLAWDVGAGITISTPLGPVRVDVAYPEAKNTKPTILFDVLYMF
ncbi:MAG: BamA/TamA family outer membrane protein [Candidatus Marinimicrobia bacterium]|nr:BamA/TamA family outer membrane protein [Candidatus Neomarinimicrobiota bacterium]MBL7023000.1 BamA/TamA family outer membrane protein [Candidatus Neomarinimicrobiota bacterium]MBL7110051.1 BamA/TamA family outer membrane protein [Candidatus Neomarinimicrobiota bacterium]